MVVRCTTTYSISVYITTKIVNSIPAHGDVYSIQHYVTVGFTGTLVSYTNEIYLHDITEIIMKVALRTIILTPKWIIRSVYRRKDDKALTKMKREKDKQLSTKHYTEN